MGKYVVEFQFTGWYESTVEAVNDEQAGDKVYEELQSLGFDFDIADEDITQIKEDE